ncbi:hypothetical protein ACM92D_003157 [Cronobacter dublinensis]
MRELNSALLTMLAAVLALWLVLGFWPVSAGSRVALAVCILLMCAAVLWRQRRGYLRRQALSTSKTQEGLPPEDFQGPVVLVCGDTASLFTPDARWRETRQGWYLNVPDAGELPAPPGASTSSTSSVTPRWSAVSSGCPWTSRTMIPPA